MYCPAINVTVPPDLATEEVQYEKSDSSIRGLRAVAAARTDSFGIGVWIVVAHPCSSAIDRMSVIGVIGFMANGGNFDVQRWS